MSSQRVKALKKQNDRKIIQWSREAPFEAPSSNIFERGRKWSRMKLKLISMQMPLKNKFDGCVWTDIKRTAKVSTMVRQARDRVESPKEESRGEWDQRYFSRRGKIEMNSVLCSFPSPAVASTSESGTWNSLHIEIPPNLKRPSFSSRGWDVTSPRERRIVEFVRRKKIHGR